jgi:catechol-2,3-dioxygenase
MELLHPAAPDPEEPGMAITRLNHAVLYVRDLERSVAFYQDALGFRQVMALPGAAFLQAAGSTNDHDLGLFAVGVQAGASAAGRTSVGLYHLAWEVETLAELDRLTGEETIGVAPLDLPGTIARYGAQTRGGVGISS